jgi:hypothetical protein
METGILDRFPEDFRPRKLLSQLQAKHISPNLNSWLDLPGSGTEVAATAGVAACQPAWPM